MSEEGGKVIPMEFVIGLLGTGVGAGIMVIIQMLLNRKWAKEDKQEAKADKLDELTARLDKMDSKLDSAIVDLSHVKAADKSILSDRIKWLGTRYLEAGEVEFEDRRILHELHDAYHNHCGGNGDYDILMRDVDELPLKHDKVRRD